MAWTTDIALQTNEGLFRVPPDFWGTIPKERFHISEDIWVGKFDSDQAKEIINACEAPGKWKFKPPVKQYAQLYAFAREIGDTQDLNWDTEDRLYTCLALSRIVHPTTISLAYAARLRFNDEQLEEIIPGNLKGHASAAYLPEEAARDWLTVENLEELRDLYRKMNWPTLPMRARQAIFKYDHSAGDRFLDISWPKLYSAVEGLVHVSEDYETAERQFVLRSSKLAEMLEIRANPRDFEEILRIRTAVQQGEVLTHIKGEHLRLYLLLSDLIRGSVKKAIVDESFSQALKDDALLRRALPLAEPRKGFIKAVRGTRDILPPDTALWQHVEQAAREVFQRCDFHEIRTPIFEDTQLFARGVGEETDIVSKEMFTWEDRPRAQSEKAQSLTLRPENTAGVVRAYIEHKLGETGKLQKLYYIGPQFRRERPQKGRFRQFYQIGAEVLGPPSAGSESPARDAEIITMLAQLLREVGIRNWELQLNSVGCADDRARYNQALREALAEVKDKMCADCRRRAETNPLRVLDCKVPEDQPIIESLPKISAYLDDPCREHFNEVRKILNHVGIRYYVNERMVRGLDYYTRTTFEFTHGGLGAQSALLGGGRYDGLSEALGGPKAPGIGFALGLDRFVLALQAEETVGIPDQSPVVYVAPLGQGMNAEAAVIARDLRKQQIAAELGDETFRAKKSFEAAERSGAKFILFVGENEIASGNFALKDLKTGEQMDVAREHIAVKLKS